MLRYQILTAAAFVGVVSSSTAWSQDVRTYEQDGVTYRETHQKVQRPMTEVQMKNQERTVYVEQYKTELNESTRTYYLPVTEYVWEAQWEGRWNPFGQPYLAYHMVPKTHLEPRTEIVKTPITRRDVVAQTHVEQVPVTTQRMVEDEHISRVAVAVRSTNGGAVTASSTSTSTGIPIGGVSNFNDNIPRNGTGDATRR